MGQVTRFEIDGAGVGSTLRSALDTSTGCVVVLERRLRSERLRQVQAVPRHASIAWFGRIREGHQLQLVHPGPLKLATPIDEFEVAQAIGSMLDGLAWLHAHGVTHGAVDAAALAAGPTGGRLSLAGALSEHPPATPEDDVYAAAALAFSLLVGDTPGPAAYSDPRLKRSASRAVAEAVCAGLHPDATQRPSAATFGIMIRGERVLPVGEVCTRQPLSARLHLALACGVALLTRFATSLAHTLRPRWRTVSAGVGVVAVIAGLAAAEQSSPHTFTTANSPPGESTTLVAATRGEPASPSSLASAAVGVTAPDVTISTGAATPIRPEPPVPAEAAANAFVAPTEKLAPTTPTSNAPPTTTTARQPVPTTTTSPTTTATTTPPPASTRQIYYLINPGSGNTSSDATLTMTTSAPTASALPNYDTDRDSSPGRLLQKSGNGINETDPQKYQRWSTNANPGSLAGDASLRVRVAVKDFAIAKQGRLTAALQACTASLSTCRTIRTATALIDQTQAPGDFVDTTFNFGNCQTTISPSEVLSVKLVVDNNSDDDLWIAYGTTSYPSALTATTASETF